MSVLKWKADPRNYRLEEVKVTISCTNWKCGEEITFKYANGNEQCKCGRTFMLKITALTLEE